MSDNLITEEMEHYNKKIIIVEDNEEVREGFALVLSSIGKHHVVNTYSNCEDALKRLRKDQPDIVLMDLELPGMHGIDGITEIRKQMPHVNILVITVYEDNEMVFNALCAGATGYITKNMNHTDLLGAIDELANGGAPMSAKIAKMVVKSFQKNLDSPLTTRETEVLELLSKGKSYNMIADELFITRETAKTHIKHIYNKLQVNSKADAIAKAISSKLI